MEFFSKISLKNLNFKDTFYVKKEDGYNSFHLLEIELWPERKKDIGDWLLKNKDNIYTKITNEHIFKER